MLLLGVESTAFPIASSLVEAVPPCRWFQGEFHLQKGSLSSSGHSITQPHEFLCLSLLILKGYVGCRLEENTGTAATRRTLPSDFSCHSKFPLARGQKRLSHDTC